MTTPDPVREAAQALLDKLYELCGRDPMWASEMSSLRAALSAPPPQVPRLRYSPRLQWVHGDPQPYAAMELDQFGDYVPFDHALDAASPPPNTPREE